MDKFRVSHSLLNSYNSWLNAESDYNDYYGRSENPDVSAEEFETERKLSFYSSLFRMEVIEEYQQDNKALELGKQVEERLFRFDYSDFAFTSNKGLKCYVELGEDFKAQCVHLSEVKGYNKQVKVSGEISNVPFIGYIDLHIPGIIYDIKTTSNFNPENYLASTQLGLYDRFLKGINDLYYIVFVFEKKEANTRNKNIRLIKGVETKFDLVYRLTDIVNIQAEPLSYFQFKEIECTVSEINRLYKYFETDFEKYKHFFKPRETK
jgi:hypothetical protein